jgi:glucokinase
MDGAHTVGLDLGGTKILSAVVSPENKILARAKQATGAESNAKAVTSRIIETVRKSLEKLNLDARDLQGIGVAVPGTLERESGRVLETPNLGLEGYPLGPVLEEAFSVPVILANDVSAGVYGEYVAGAAQGYQHVVGFFVGTGIGGGIVLNGRLFGGPQGNAAELGHTIVQYGGALCSCGQRGCLESVASRTAIAKEVVALAGSGAAPTILARAGTDYKLVKSGILRDSVRAGEDRVTQVIERAADYLGVGMANAVNTLTPQMIILGGGLVEKLGDFYIQAAERSMRAHSMRSLRESVQVAAAGLGDDAVVIGASALVRESGRG